MPDNSGETDILYDLIFMGFNSNGTHVFFTISDNKMPMYLLTA